MLNSRQESDRQLTACDNSQTTEQTLHKLRLRREEELRLASLVKNTSLDYEEGQMHDLQRSSTDYFGQMLDMNETGKSLTSKAKKIFSSPKLKRKTHSHVLRAASSIPSRM